LSPTAMTSLTVVANCREVTGGEDTRQLPLPGDVSSGETGVGMPENCPGEQNR